MADAEFTHAKLLELLIYFGPKKEEKHGALPCVFRIYGI